MALRQSAVFEPQRKCRSKHFDPPDRVFRLRCIYFRIALLLSLSSTGGKGATAKYPFIFEWLESARADEEKRKELEEEEEEEEKGATREYFKRSPAFLFPSSPKGCGGKKDFSSTCNAGWERGGGEEEEEEGKGEYWNTSPFPLVPPSGSLGERGRGVGGREGGREGALKFYRGRHRPEGHQSLAERGRRGVSAYV